MIRTIAVHVTRHEDGFLSADDQIFRGTTEDFAEVFGIRTGAAMPIGDVSDGNVTIEWSDES